MQQVVLVIIACLAIFMSTTQFLVPLVMPPLVVSVSSDISGFYQSSGLHARVVEAVLRNFRVFYPISRVSLWLSHPPSSTVVSYAHFYSVLGINSGNATVFTNATAAVVFWSSLAAAADKSDWLLLLEDDIWLYSHINVGGLKYSINGAPCSELFRPGVWLFLSTLNESNKRQLCYPRMGGSIIRSSTLAAAPNQSNVGFFQALIDAGSGWIGRDELVAATVVAGGGDIGAFSGFSETWWRWGNAVLRAPRWSSF